MLADQRKAVNFYARLTNPPKCLSVADMANKPISGPVALFPPSTSPEAELFERLFGGIGIPPNVDLMRELVQAIRSGKVDLTPRPQSGWYDQQVYALETLLLPGRGQEKDKLLLTRAYKKRLVEAFKALMTKRRETHLRQLEPIPLGCCSSMPAPQSTRVIRPRLRVEPNPTFYLRTARAYAFLTNMLEASIGQEALRQIHGLTEKGERRLSLAEELAEMRNLFYGLYLVSAEDIGLKPVFASEEMVDADRCIQTATQWLGKALTDDGDLATDTRVAVPIAFDRERKITRLWLTLGVRLAKLEARYECPPKIRPEGKNETWQDVSFEELKPADYLIPVDEFAEVEIRGYHALTRDEYRAVCDRNKTKEAILKALRRW